MNVFNIVFFVIILIVNRKTIGIGTVLYTFTLGTFCTVVDPWIVAAIGDQPTMTARILLILTGTLALGVGLGVYQSAEFGCGPSDAFNQTVAKKLKMQLRWWRIIFDAVIGRRSDYGRCGPCRHLGGDVPGGAGPGPGAK